MIVLEAFEKRQARISTMGTSMHNKLSHAEYRYMEDDDDYSGQPSHMHLRRELAVIKARYRSWTERQALDEPHEGSKTLTDNLKQLRIERLEVWLMQHRDDKWAGMEDHPLVLRWVRNIDRLAKLRGKEPLKMAA